ncbi:SGNH/GDSL hydrolase family protein [Kistimonas asteriae]|uniref:SGNH/GDSL hydrolase family protein n=1 Tax=Kistimonas asteriae TaxID=517724 RepID=UPI001BAABFCD|nr:SGNH/GDSL hydrolase family protein [Kistimonas asteriae]
MKTILCYGDSITWGYIPGTAARYPLHQRWPSVLQATLGHDYHVIAEGLTGRYTMHEDPFRVGRNGAELLQPIMETHSPIDLLILFLGTNDVLHHQELTAYDAAQGVAFLTRSAQCSPTGPAGAAPKVMIISPPRIHALSHELLQQCHGDISQSESFGKHFRAVATQHHCLFLDAAEIVEPSPLDGVHLDEHALATLGVAIANKVRSVVTTDAASV